VSTSNVTHLDPAILHGRFLDPSGKNLNPNIVTDSYQGGIPQGPGDLKVGMIREGQLKSSLTVSGGPSYPHGILKRGLCKSGEAYQSYIDGLNIPEE